MKHALACLAVVVAFALVGLLQYATTPQAPTSPVALVASR